MKICILEDDRAQTERMIEYLKRYQGEHGGVSYVLETYSQAFDLLNAYRGDADLVFLDIRLPDQLGIFPFSYSLQRRRHFLLRLAVSLGGGMLAVEILTRLLFAQGLVAEFAVITMLYVLLNLIVWFCYKESAWTALFVTALGYVLQDMASGVKAALRYTLPTKLFADMTATTPGVFLFFEKSKLYKTENIYKMKKQSGGRHLSETSRANPGKMCYNGPCNNKKKQVFPWNFNALTSRPGPEKSILSTTVSRCPAPTA